jgi:uncharacterized protein YndB with AHSA1/START domain
MTIRKSIWVACGQERSFKAFCEEMSEWWPGGFGGKDSIPRLELKVGGRFYERKTDGTEFDIGRVVEYQPPMQVAFTWRAPSWEATTRVDVRFSAERGGTRIELEHSGWEQDAKTRDGRKNYDSGWDTVLGYYQSFAAAAAGVNR